MHINQVYIKNSFFYFLFVNKLLCTSGHFKLVGVLFNKNFEIIFSSLFFLGSIRIREPINSVGQGKRAKTAGKEEMKEYSPTYQLSRTRRDP